VSKGAASEKSKKQQDLGVQWIAYYLGWLQKKLNRIAYTPLARRWEASGRLPVYFNYAYIAGWALVMGLLVLAAWATPWALPFAAIASLRVVEVVLWYLKLLFDRTHEKLFSAERNLIFLILDGGSVLVACGLWLRAAAATSEAAPIWSATLTTFTLNGVPSGYTGWEATLGTVIGSIGGLILLGAGLALLIGLIGDRFDPGGSEKDYTGPLCPPRPTRKPWEPM
jgi:hypothetical protein